MELKSTEKEFSDTVSPTFPCLMKSNDGNRVIILFEKPGEGIVLFSPIKEEIGNFSQCWNMLCFEPYYGFVTIESTKD